LAVLKLVDGVAEEPDELVVVVGLEEPPPQPAKRAANPRMPAAGQAFFGTARLRIGITPWN
jgi:hypothetical protein